jgi:hypothetical protein
VHLINIAIAEFPTKTFGVNGKDAQATRLG